MAFTNLDNVRFHLIPKRPLLLLFLFILTNSISGFLAHSITNSKDVNFDLIIPLSIVVPTGGIIGSMLGAFKFDHTKIIIIIGILVAVADY